MIDRATELLQRGKVGQATTVIRQALWPEGAIPPVNEAPVARAATPRPVVDAPAAFRTGFHSPSSVPPTTPQPVPSAGPRPGRFVDGTLAMGDLRGRYKLYTPAGHEGASLPLIVLLHGCTQDPDDFAAGTGMNRRADEQGCCVLYPAQSTGANPSRCWNWFRRDDQQRGRGEPALIVAMTAKVIAEHDIDPARVYIAGLSAGGAMAAIVASRYPDVFAAVGVHSGLPDGAAGNLPDALAAMRSGAKRGAANASATSASAVPTIVFHGDGDSTVNPANGQRLVEAATRGFGALEQRVVTEPVAGRRKSFTRVEYLSASHESVVESWVVHGGAHAWSGGHAGGTYTDPDGPSATDAMLRFFLTQRLHE